MMGSSGVTSTNKKKGNFTKNFKNNFFGYSNKKNFVPFEKVGSGSTFINSNFKSSKDFFSKNADGKFRPSKPTFSFINKYGPAFKKLALKKKKDLNKM